MLMPQSTCDLQVLHSAGPELWWSPTSEGGGGQSWCGVPKMFGVGMWPKPVLLSPKFSFLLPYLRHK